LPRAAARRLANGTAGAGVAAGARPVAGDEDDAADAEEEAFGAFAAFGRGDVGTSIAVQVDRGRRKLPGIFDNSSFGGSSATFDRGSMP